MHRYATIATLTAMVIVLMTLTASAQIPLNMNYQARLADSTGSPVPDSSYDLEFRFYSDSTGGAPVWTESFFDVFTSNGFFDVFLEMDLDNLNGPLFMEVMVEGQTMLPRARMATVPYSAISQRVQGDIVTGEGFIRMSIPPDPYHPVAEIMSDENTNTTSFKMSIPPDPMNPVIEMSADPLQSSIKVIDPVDKREGFVALTGSSGNSIKLLNPDDDTASAIIMSAGPVQSSIKVIDPVDKREGFVLLTETAGNSLKLMDPGDDGITLIEINGGIDGNATYKMFNPQPEPPAVLMEMSAAPSSGASFRMFNPQPEPPADPLLEMNTTQYGASFAMAGPQAAGPGDEITDPMFEVIADSTGGAINLNDLIGRYMGLEPCPFAPGGMFQMYDPVADAVKFEVETTEDGASIDIYDEIGKYMGLEPMPFSPGGFLYMIDPSGFVDDTTITLGSNGYISADKGVTIGSNTNTGNHTLVMGAQTGASGENSFAGGREAQANHDNCFVWSDFPFGPMVIPLQTSVDNQFLVRASGGIAFYTNASMTYGVSLGPNDYTWNSIVPPLTVLNSRDVDGSDILNKMEQLPVKRFSADGETEHISLSPEEFNRLFNVGANDNQISLQDQAGVALAGMKEIINIISELRDKNAELERRIAELERTR